MKSQQGRCILLRMPRKEKSQIDAEAQERGLSTTELIRRAVPIYCGLPESLLETTILEAEKRRLPPAHVFTARLITMYAAQKAWIEVFETPPPSINRPFKFDETSGELVWGTELLKRLFDEYCEIFKSFKEKADRQKIDEQPFISSPTEMEGVLGQL